ncbi:hypothetical protein MTsPCn5_16450 [Croceitalea sp. MTPC5]|uniref:hypothetical protein n=1 Tax=Croceitalea sp. MTPC5 TaxID=3056565 RepID=UPI002B3BD28D|nr:hypothetical protein MTsPCn5_16450 [Croceitalea sp. MTPC5]
MKKLFLYTTFVTLFLQQSDIYAQIDFGTVQLYNSVTEQPILNISDGATYYLDTVGDSLNIVATPPNGVIVESVRFLTSINEGRTESTPPYAFNGDYLGDYYSWITLPNHIGVPINFTVEYWSANGANGTLVGDDSFTITFQTNTPSSGNSPWIVNGQNIYYDSGNVGIGLQNPNAKLNLLGNLRIDHQSSAMHSYSGSGIELWNNTIQPNSPYISVRSFVGQNNKLFSYIEMPNQNSQLKIGSVVEFETNDDFSWGLDNWLKTRFKDDVYMDRSKLGIGTSLPDAPLEIKQDDDPSVDRGLIISEKNNAQKIYLHLADNANGEYGYLSLGGDTQLRGNGQISYFDGNLGIGTTNPGSYKLAVNGNIRAKEVKVETGWADYVFKEDYPLPSLKEVEKHIKEKGHLINIPSAKEVQENGIHLGEMNKLLLEKIEELTLYTIQQQKELQNQKTVNLGLVERLEKIEKQLRIPNE